MAKINKIKLKKKKRKEAKKDLMFRQKTEIIIRNLKLLLALQLHSLSSASLAIFNRKKRGKITHR